MEPHSQDAQSDAREQDSLAPFQLDRLTIEEEVAVMNRGKGLQLISVVAIAGVLIAGGAMAMRGLDHEQKLSQAGAAATDLRREHLDGYLHCVLPSAHESALLSSERLHGALEGFAERLQKRYASTLRSCEPKLAALGPALAVLPAPSELEPAIAQLRKAAGQTHSAATALREYLSDPNQGYEYVRVTALIDRLARASVDYRGREETMQQLLDPAR